MCVSDLGEALVDIEARLDYSISTLVVQPCMLNSNMIALGMNAKSSGHVSQGRRLKKIRIPARC